jgi:hypothetical protein
MPTAPLPETTVDLIEPKSPEALMPLRPLPEIVEEATFKPCRWIWSPSNVFPDEFKDFTEGVACWIKTPVPFSEVDR